jgi:predicted ATPase
MTTNPIDLDPGVPSSPPGFAVRIARIAVKRLFGAYDHSVTLNADARVTIVLGPNGVGKTQLLECVAALFQGRLQRLGAIPFELLQVDLDDGASLRVHQIHDPEIEAAIAARAEYHQLSRKARPSLRSIVVELHRADGTVTDPWNVTEEHAKTRERAELPPWIESDGFGRWLDRRHDRSLTSQQVAVLYNVDERSLDTPADAPQWFAELLKRTLVRLIETQRLLRTQPRSREPRVTHREEAETVRFAVRDVAENMAERIREARARYAREAAVLDRTYVDRFLQYSFGESPDVAVLQERLDTVVKRRARLEELGLLDAEEHSPDARQISAVAAEKRGALALYADDMDRKLRTLEPLAASISKLLDALNGKLRSKRVRADQRNGLYVETAQAKRVELQQLSSGEQHELVLLYDLIFRVRPNSLVLIDEPELSLHPLWQQQFVDDLLTIAAPGDFDVLIATHSPYIVGSRTDLCVPLSDTGVQ